MLIFEVRLKRKLTILRVSGITGKMNSLSLKSLGVVPLILMEMETFDSKLLGTCKELEMRKIQLATTI